MKIKVKDLKSACQAISKAIGTDNVKTLYSTSLSLKTVDKGVSMTVTDNGGYTVTVSIDTDVTEPFNAVVEGQKFLKLMSQVTDDDADICVSEAEHALKMSAGYNNYVFPLIYNGDSMLDFKEIELGNTVCEQDISGTILGNIFDYNLKEMQRGPQSREFSKYCYIDEKGAVAAVVGGCVYNFSLREPVKMLLSEQTVKFLTLFRNDDKVRMVLGKRNYNGSDVYTLKLESDSAKVVTMLNGMFNPSTLSSFPVEKCREYTLQNDKFVLVSKKLLVEAIDRLSILLDPSLNNRCYIHIETNDYSDTWINITDRQSGEVQKVVERLRPTAHTDGVEYEFKTDLTLLKSVLSTCADGMIKIGFGTRKFITVTHQDTIDIIPEVIH